MLSRLSSVLLVLAIVTAALCGCGGPAGPEGAESPSTSLAGGGDVASGSGESPCSALEPRAGEGFRICQVTDTGGIDDKSFNATAWRGIQNAVDGVGVEGAYLESQEAADYEPNIGAFIDQGCDLIVTVGYFLGDATRIAAETNPNQAFSIVDFAYDPVLPNVLGQVFTTDEAAFLAGYVSAGVSETGIVGTFGGFPVPVVTIFMEGFYYGVQYYNQQHGTSVQVLGWDPSAPDQGLMSNSFEDADAGRRLGESLIDEGADVILPVAGPVGLGTAAAAMERGGVYIIGVDSDWYLTAPEYGSIILTSVLKNTDVTTQSAICQVVSGEFTGGVTIGTLANGGVGLAPFHDLESLVSAELQAELEAVRLGIIAGAIDVSPPT